MVEILLATYNGEKYIRAQLDSLLAQTVTDSRILVRDDGSKDGTVAIIKEYCKTYPDKVILCEDDVKCGSSQSNFMQLCKYATADYLAFSDQDDYWLPEKLEKSLEQIKLLEAKVGESKPCLVFGDYIPVDGELNDIPFDPSKNQVAGLHLEFNRLLAQNYVTGCLMFVNKPLYTLLGDFDEAIQMHDWWAAFIASSMGGIEHFNYTLMKYRQHGGNVVGATDVKSMEYRMAKIKDKGTRDKQYLAEKQAILFKERYYDLMDETSRKQLDGFINIYTYKSKLHRMLALLKGNYTKSDLIRTLGQLWYI